MDCNVNLHSIISYNNTVLSLPREQWRVLESLTRSRPATQDPGAETAGAASVLA